MKRFFRFNKILTKRGSLVLFAVFVFSGLFLFSHQANAFLDVIPSLASMQLDALDFLDRIVASIFYLLLLAIGSGFFISFSASLLDWASSIPVGLSDNLLVNAGWGFLSGLVNMVFILIFVAIALSYILKIDTWEMKKALPRLIIVAFLLNFSLIFVKIFVDIGWLVQNSFKATFFGSDGLAAPIALKINASLWAVVSGYVRDFFVPYYVAALIPFANVARLIWLGGTILGGGPFMGTLSQAIVLVAFGLVGGLIFFIYALLFLVRIAAIWILAVAAPLALAAYILPQTQKYFQQWLKALFQWVFLGVVVFFLMGLGLKFFNAVAPSAAFRIGNGFDLVAEFSRFLFLIIYMVLSLSYAKKFTPTAASAVWSFGEMAIGRGTKWAGGVAGKFVKGAPKPAYADRAELATKKWAERIPLFGRALGGTGATGARLSKDIAKITEEFKGRSPADIRAAISRTALTPQGRMRRAAGLQMLAEMNALQPGDINFLRDAQTFGANINAITSKMPSWTTPTAAERATGMTIPQAITNRVQRIAANQARNIHAQDLTNNNVIRALSSAQLQDFTRAGTAQQRQNIVNSMRALLGPGVSPGPGTAFSFVPPGPPIAGVDRGVINYIGGQQAAGTWPT